MSPLSKTPETLAPPEYQIGDLLLLRTKGVWTTIVSKKLVMSSWAGTYNIFEYEVMLPDGKLKTITQNHLKD